MKNKFKIWLALISFIIIASCIWDDDSYISEKHKISRSDEEIVTFKNNEDAVDTFRLTVSYDMEHYIDLKYHETGFIYYDPISYSDYFNNCDFTIFQTIHEITVTMYLDDYSGISTGIGGVYYQKGYNSEKPKNVTSYQQNGHIYPDVYTFEMDTATAMENWDTTMNLFPDVRKVWYSLSRGIVRYDMKDGESFRLVE